MVEVITAQLEEGKLKLQQAKIMEGDSSVIAKF